MEPRETHRRRSCSAPPRRNAAGQDRGAARRVQAHASIGPVILPSTTCRLYYRLVSKVTSALFSWAVDREWITHNPIAKVKALPGGHLRAWTATTSEPLAPSPSI